MTSFKNLITSVINPSSVYPSSFPLTPRVMYDLEDQGNIAINLLPLLANDIKAKGEQQSQSTKAHKSVTSLSPLLTGSDDCISLAVCLFCNTFQTFV